MHPCQRWLAGDFVIALPRAQCARRCLARGEPTGHPEAPAPHLPSMLKDPAQALSECRGSFRQPDPQTATAKKRSARLAQPQFPAEETCVPGAGWLNSSGNWSLRGQSRLRLAESGHFTRRAWVSA